MAILLRTRNPQGIIEKLKKLIDEQQIHSWNYDEDGDFVYSKEPRIIAWIRPVLESNRLCFYIIGRNDVAISLREYALLHSRFMETLITYFPTESKNIVVTFPLVNVNDSKNILNHE